MTARIPHGLVRVVSATQREEPSDPADLVYERKTALFNFWKVHAIQSRATADASNIRCRQLFWRVWGDRHLSFTLSEATLMQLWLQCQQGFDLSPFQLQIVDSSSSSALESANSSTSQNAERRLSKESQYSSNSASVSPTYIAPDQGSFDNGQVASSSKAQQNSRAPNPRPGINRTVGGETSRKRSSVTSDATRAKNRPSVSRKKSSQSEKSSETIKRRRSVIKSPRLSDEGQGKIEQSDDPNIEALAQQIATPTTASELLGRKISTFELPSASSWQSIESHTEASASATKPSRSPAVGSLVIEKNFRERFLENQSKLRSSTNLAGMGRSMRKTGSVVRFADEVDVSDGFRHLVKSVSASDRQQVMTSPQIGVSSHRAASEGQQPQPDQSSLTHGESRPWRPSRIERHDSVGSVAAVSDDGSDGLPVEVIPRTRSQLSLGIADLKRSQSLSETDGSSTSGNVITSPQIEEEQDALISGKATKKLSEEEEKLLAMGRKGGVTKAGGINLPKELTIKGKFEIDDDENLEESHF